MNNGSHNFPECFCMLTKPNDFHGIIDVLEVCSIINGFHLINHNIMYTLFVIVFVIIIIIATSTNRTTIIFMHPKSEYDRSYKCSTKNNTVNGTFKKSCNIEVMINGTFKIL